MSEKQKKRQVRIPLLPDTSPRLARVVVYVPDTESSRTELLEFVKFLNRDKDYE